MFGSRTSPFISSSALFLLLVKHEAVDPDLMRKIKRAIWVDDILLSFDSMKDGQEAIEKISRIFAKG